ncbi:energy transducer TonB [Novosphingobium sp. CCH12-A3]|uniref:energy transducer TonB n=1 Tax=Novosphingobium sp. CCH12-A3 TaxID=1768752 RepID=UPI0018D25F75|nr:energy transducer TonB [Novosphingobium sp. CCH12-A3]
MAFLFVQQTAWAAEPRSPKPKGNPGEWVTTRDYPSEALRNEQEGTVGFRILVGTEGVPSGCEVTMSSGSAMLDSATCDLIQSRARFSPAMDAEGKAVVGTYSNSVRWTIPEDAPMEFGPGEFEASFVIGPDGHAHDCKVEKMSGSVPFSTEDTCNPKDRFLVPTGRDGKPVTRRVRMRLSIEVEEVAQPQ